MPEVAEEDGPGVLASRQSVGADGSGGADVEETRPAGSTASASHSHRKAFLDAAADVPIAALQTVSLALRRYGAELLAFVATVAVCRYLLGIPALALGAIVGVATYLVRVAIWRFRR
jgi:hypothetical protein